MPCASFKMEMPNNHSYFVRFIIKNHSKVSIQCWCKLNASVNGISIEMPGFYNGQTPFDIQPFGEVGGFFSLGDIMSKAGENATSLVQKKTNDNLKELLYMDIEFWYNKIGEDRIIENPKQPHYYNFATNQLVTDF